jgi:two-component system chemotaxis response regulator CheY
MDYRDPVTANGKMGRVLVVDDVAVVRKSIRMTLTNTGYDVVEAEDGEHAMATLQAIESFPPVDAILCDLRMPQINGAELIACFRRRYPAIPVVALIAYPDVELAVSLMRQGVMDFLVKPVLQDELLSVVKRAVEQNAAPNDRVVSYKELRQGAENQLGKRVGG